MTKADWLLFAKSLVAVFVIFYLRVWLARAGSWKAARKHLWKRPRRWQLITFCVLWGFIIIAFITLVFLKR